MSRIWMSIFVLGSIALGCKSQTASEVKATPAQKNKLRICIVSTVLETFPEAQNDLAAVNKFASEMAAKAPTSNSNEKDPAFEAYVNEMGCDPKLVSGSKNYGITIVEQWVMSPYNTQVIGPKDSSASELKLLKNRGAQ